MRRPRPGRLALAPAWPGVWLLAGAHLLAFADRFIAALVAPAIKADLRLSDFELGLVQGTAFVAAYAVASLAAGPLVDRLHRPRLIAAGVLVWGLASLACGLATGLGELVLGRAALGLGQAVLTPAALALIAARQPRDRIGQGVSLYVAGATLGRATAMGLGGGLLALLPAMVPLGPGAPVAAWRVLFALSVVPNLVLAVLLLRLPDPGRGGGRPARRQALAPWLARHAGRYAVLAVAGVAVTLVVQTTNAWAVTLLVRRFGLSLPSAGMVFGTIVAVAAPLGQVAGGRLLDRTARRGLPGGRLVLGALLGTLPLAATVGLADDRGLALTALAALIFGLGIGSVATLAGLQLMTPRALRGRVTAPFVACTTLAGFGLGPPLVGLLADRVFGEAGLGQALLAASLPAYAAGIIALLLGARYLRGPAAVTEEDRR
ncbi:MULTISPECIES: MFS transporter [Methylobacterium]|jgi:MFS family permease|uniref:MFS transporter n=1 Tax=Methylobacterium TaxID=407 RepID=UPI0008E20201|nr:MULTISPECIES: MFS transporter [Methylobacterium]MBK3398634.1 MFS transporter [Methylobacterium ajmalii]MBK3411386.1 MFS transporter [Methylobacterium ajmalii]MBZ6413224.1 MFS transporter [Methylobacterium sp.]SFF42902.1 Sugar phosphate permease [Methylobacterium sp. yr596]